MQHYFPGCCWSQQDGDRGHSGLLQDVVRNWYARLPSAVQNANTLVSNAEECAQALRQGMSPCPWARPALLMTEETQTFPGRACVVLGEGRKAGGVQVLAAAEASNLPPGPLACYRQCPKFQA